MTPLPVQPRVVLQLDPLSGRIEKTANNIIPDLEIVVTSDPLEFNELSKGNPFIHNELEEMDECGQPVCSDCGCSHSNSQ